MTSSKKKHVLFLTYHLPMVDEPGAFRPWMEARLLGRAGFDVTVVTSGTQYMTGKDIRSGKGWCTEEVREGIRILRTWEPTDHRRSLLRRAFNYITYTMLTGFAALFKTGKIDRVFAGTDPIFMMPMVYLVSRIKNAALVLDERDLYPETAIALGVMQEGRLSRILFSMQQFYRSKSHAILAATPGIRSKLINYGHSENKVFLLYNADVFIDEDFKNKAAKYSLKKMTGKRFLAGYAGGLGKANDIATLLRAAKYLADINDMGIVVIGSGERGEDYKKFCLKYGLKNVFFLDAVPRHQVRQLMSQFDLCVQPLPKNTHFGSTLTSKTFDYHGVGRPMIFCGCGDTADLLAMSGGGISVRSEAHKALAGVIRNLYQNEKQCHSMGESGRNWFVENIGIEKTVTSFHKIFC